MEYEWRHDPILFYIWRPPLLLAVVRRFLHALFALFQKTFQRAIRTHIKFAQRIELIKLSRFFFFCSLSCHCFCFVIFTTRTLVLIDILIVSDTDLLQLLIREPKKSRKRGEETQSSLLSLQCMPWSRSYSLFRMFNLF